MLSIIFNSEGMMPTLTRHVLQWGLVCERAYIAPLVTTVYFCGVMLGGVIFGGLSDRLGRKWVMLFCLYSQCTIGIGLHFVQRLAVFMGLRFVQGILIQVQYSTLQYSTVQGVLIQGLQCVSYSMIMELFCPAYRTLAGCVAEAFWAAGEELIGHIPYEPLD